MILTISVTAWLAQGPILLSAQRYNHEVENIRIISPEDEPGMFVSVAHLQNQPPHTVPATVY